MIYLLMESPITSSAQPFIIVCKYAMSFPPERMSECLWLNDLICHPCDQETNDQKLASGWQGISHPFHIHIFVDTNAVD